MRDSYTHHARERDGTFKYIDEKYTSVLLTEIIKAIATITHCIQYLMHPFVTIFKSAR